MHFIKHILLLVAFLSLIKHSNSQTYASKEYYLVDSLNLDALAKTDRELIDKCLKTYYDSKLDINKIHALDHICQFMMHEDWSKYQFFQYSLIQKALSTVSEPAMKNALLNSLAKAYNNMGVISMHLGDKTTALEYYMSSLKIREEIGDELGIATCLNNIGFFVQHHEGDFKKALDYYLRGLSIREDAGDKIGIANSLNNIGAVYFTQGNVHSSLGYYYRSLKIEQEIGNKPGISTCLNNIGTIYDSQGDIHNALEIYLKSLKIKEEIGDKKGIAACLSNIGRIYNHQDNLQQALACYSRSLKILEEIGNQYGIATSLNHIAITYKDHGDMATALNYNAKSLKIREEIGDKLGIATSLNNIGFIYYKQGNVSAALKHYNQSLKIKEEIGDKEGIVYCLINIGDLNMQSGELTAARINGERALQISQELGYPKLIADNTILLSNIFSKRRNFEEALEMYKLHVEMRDSINNQETKKQAIKQNMEYSFEKQKALDDAAHDKQLAIEHEEKEKQEVLTISTACGLVLVVIFLIFVFNRLRVTKRQKLVIEIQKEEVEKSKMYIELQHKEITDSIKYAKRIQSAILPPAKIVKEYLKDSFILYKPKDVVAGDFYWMEPLGGKGLGPNSKGVLFAAADCTGHGVPGAMVSVVCNNALNRSVREYGLSKPGEVLDKTREIVIQEFDKSEEEVMDGMDIALCLLEGNRLEYAGANNPLLIIRKGEVIETKPNKQPIGKFDNPLPYTTHTFDLEKGDTIYIFSDGYIDQFGGEKGKKLKTKAFKSLLLSIQDKPMDQQRIILDESFENWKGSLEQIDDVCIVGVRI